MIRVLIVEDSLSVRLLLQEILESSPDLQVVGSVDSGEAALQFLENHPPHRQPHIVTMDIVMEGMDGFTATRRIMECYPLPIVIVSAAFKPQEAELSFKAIDAGAVAIIEKPVAPSHPDYVRVADNLIKTVRLMSEVKVVTRWARQKTDQPTHPAPAKPVLPTTLPTLPIEVIVIGTSTGGPPVLKTLLSILPHQVPVPLLVVQHITRGFIEGMGYWLQNATGFPVHIPRNGDTCQPGHVYLAPDDYHMAIDAGKRISLSASPPENGHRPSVSFLFRSAAQFFPRTTLGILLTGMGNDGALELRLIKDAGSITIAQDEASCIVFGMPGEAVKNNAAHFVLPPEAIAWKISHILENRIKINPTHL